MEHQQYFIYFLIYIIITSKTDSLSTTMCTPRHLEQVFYGELQNLVSKFWVCTRTYFWLFTTHSWRLWYTVPDTIYNVWCTYIFAKRVIFAWFILLSLFPWTVTTAHVTKRSAQVAGPPTKLLMFATVTTHGHWQLHESA